MLVFCEECGGRNFIAEDRSDDQFRCTSCGYVNMLRSPDERQGGATPDNLQELPGSTGPNEKNNGEHGS